MSRIRMRARLALALAAAVLVLGSVPCPAQAPSAVQERADRFLELVNSSYQALVTVEQSALWDAATDVTPAHDAAADAASKARAAFTGNPALITEAKALLEHRAELDPAHRAPARAHPAQRGRGADDQPGAGAGADRGRDAAAVDAERLHLHAGRAADHAERDRRPAREAHRPGRSAARCGRPRSSRAPRSSPGSSGCRACATAWRGELGYPDYFALQVARHDMTTDEMVRLNEDFLRELRPLYLQLHTWVKYELAKKYGQPVPKRIPAHWIPNRWSQEWNGMVASASLDAAFKRHDPEWIVRTAEGFWQGLGLEPLPASFWEKSDLYPVQPGETRKKNTHASCWHVDLERDIRSLMSVEANESWFGTAHHEIGHGHYDLCTVRPEVPPLLRNGASPSFHEGIATLGELAARQPATSSRWACCRSTASATRSRRCSRLALANIPFMFWASGVMTHWEADLYAHGCRRTEWNARWWRYVGDYQGVEPPAPRGEEYCDAATKTHINDFPAYYYSYAVATVITYQLNDHIARNILKSDPRRCNYAGNREVGAFLERHDAQGRDRGLAHGAARGHRRGALHPGDGRVLPAAHEVAGEAEPGPADRLGVTCGRSGSAGA